jgi:hypothetical protein
MPGVAHKVNEEYWRPPTQVPQAADIVREKAESCPRCQAELPLGARFCHVCGAEREAETTAAGGEGLGRFLDLQLIIDNLGLTVASIVAFIIGACCLIAAGATGLIYTATTALDWQAIQVWRIQWLLASIAAFLAGILLKRTA